MSAPTENNAATNVTTSNARPALNAQRRPQRLYLKVALAMKTVKKILNDDQYTGIRDWLDEAQFTDFLHEVCEIIRADYNATIDNWPTRTLHNYVPDACKAILKALQEQPELFAAADGDEKIWILGWNNSMKMANFMIFRGTPQGMKFLDDDNINDDGNEPMMRARSASTRLP
ncbi:hypothetical protein G7054_g12162 [Neopestalotiopsis clavispora]|nr:hypothetical protein G7054_g12162 [Neopestalotiopsis clavispora]